MPLLSQKTLDEELYRIVTYQQKLPKHNKLQECADVRLPRLFGRWLAAWLSTQRCAKRTLSKKEPQGSAIMIPTIRYCLVATESASDLTCPKVPIVVQPTSFTTHQFHFHKKPVLITSPKTLPPPIRNKICHENELKSNWLSIPVPNMTNYVRNQALSNTPAYIIWEVYHKDQWNDSKVSKSWAGECKRCPEKDCEQSQCNDRNMDSTDMLFLIINNLWDAFGILWIKNPEQKRPALFWICQTVANLQ